MLKSLTGKRNLFGLVSLRAQQVEFLRRLKAFLNIGVGGPTNVNVDLAAAQGSVGTVETKTIVGGVSLTPDHDRLVALEQEHIVMRTRIDGVESKLQAEAGKLTSAMSADREAQKRLHEKLEDKVKKAVVGDIDLDLAGVIWLLLGTALATFAPEMPKLWCVLTVTCKP